MRVLVTGGAGFIGHHLVKFLTENPCGLDADLFVVDSGTYAAINWQKSASIVGSRNMIRGDVCDYRELRVLFDDIKPDLVFHLAAESHVDRSLEQPGLAMFVNAIGTQNVAQICAADGIALVYCSTDEVYGDLCGTIYESDGAPVDAPLNPSSPYSAGKAAGEMAVRAIARSFGLNAAITRGCNAWGENQYPEKLVPIACNLLTQGRPVPVHGGGSQIRQWVHVDDFVMTLAEVGKALLRSPMSTDSVLTVNIWGPDRVSVRELVGAIARVAGVDHRRAFSVVSDRPGQDRSYGLCRGDARWALTTCANRSILDTTEIINLLEHYNGAVIELASFCQTEV